MPRSKPPERTARAPRRPARSNRSAGPSTPTALRQRSSDASGLAAKPAPAGTIVLYFRDEHELRHVEDRPRQDLATVAIADRTLFTTCDETATLDRLVRGEDGHFHHVENIVLGDYFDLPGGTDGEMDVEGIAIDGNELWITGSHSLRRDKPSVPVGDHDGAMATLATIERDANRAFLGRLTLTATEDGVYTVDPVAISQGGAAAPAYMKMAGKKRKGVKRLLAKDAHLAAALAMPSKENGFDIEGLAVKDGHLFLGLRGPVLRGWAVVLELDLRVKKRGQLKPRRRSGRGDRYVKHFLPLGGLGIRDLRFDGDDLLVLAGPTMDHDGAGALYRWRRPISAGDHRLHGEDELERLMELPYDRGRDQAEGIAFLETDGRRQLLVVHDSPMPSRLIEAGHGILADLHDLDD